MSYVQTQQIIAEVWKTVNPKVKYQVRTRAAAIRLLEIRRKLDTKNSQTINYLDFFFKHLTVQLYIFFISQHIGLHVVSKTQCYQEEINESFINLLT